MQQFDRWFKRLTHPLSIILFISLLVLSMVYWDRPLAECFYYLHLKTQFPIIAWFSNMGAAILYIAGLPLMAFVYRYLIHNKTVEIRWWFLWCCVTVPSVINFILKMIIGRARPQLWIDSHIQGAFGWHTEGLFHSCPSGHTTAVVGMLIGLVILFPRYRYAYLFLALALVMTRVLLAHHYLSDVLISCYLVFIELKIFFIILKHIDLKKSKQSDLKRLCALVS